MEASHPQASQSLPVIVAFDVETTGKNSETDQIVEISICRIAASDLATTLPAERVDVYRQRLRPRVPISPGAEAVHGISDADLVGEPSFADCAPDIRSRLEAAAVLVGYNVSFDIRFVQAEFERIGESIDLDRLLIVDPLRIWHAAEPRKLENAFERFVGGTLGQAHSAEADTMAVLQVLAGMRGAFDLGDLSWEDLGAFASPDRNTWVGPTNHIRWEAGHIVLGFGKYAGRPLYDIAQRDGDYLKWIQRSGKFPRHVENVCKGAMSGISAEAFADRIIGFYGPDPSAEATKNDPSAEATTNDRSVEATGTNTPTSVSPTKQV